MKKFALKGLIFVSIFLIPILLLEFKLSRLPNSYTIKRDCVEKNIEKIDLLVLGSSQSNYGIDPERFSKNSCNLANSNQDIYYDSKLLEKYLPSTKSLKSVIVGLSYFSLEFRLTNTDEYWRKYFYYQNFRIPPENNNLLDASYFSKLLAYKPAIVRGFIEKGFNVNLVDKNTPYGWFKAPPPNSPFNEKTGEERAKLHTSQMNPQLRELNLSILKSLIFALQEKNIKVILVTLPVADTYLRGVDEIKYESMVNSVNKVSEQYKVPYYNFFNDTGFVRSDFADDSDHLNTQGVDKLTKLLKEKEISLQQN